MKFDFKKLAAVLCGAALVSMLALAACSNGGTQPADNGTDAEPVPAVQHDPVTIQVFAANSLAKAMPEIMAAYQVDHPWVTFADAQYKASGDLVEMLKGGASSDILITASKATMDNAQDGGYIDQATRFDMFTNDLVVVSKKGSGIKINSLADVANYSLCIGDESVPAGNYARQALSTVGLYQGGDGGKGGSYVGIDPLLDTSVGNVCKHASSGEVDLAIVYSSDVYRFDGVEVVYQIPGNTHKNIVYPAAICSDSKVSQDAQEFIDWATSDPEAIKIWQAWGFTLA
ncbi:MAG: molybdate ABC transporter substrate-binding protein [Coriobacteriales bacterium]|nr:molybdate ABC transporter substrate-binding protein [Coriobacteriales bacterium]